MSLPLKLAPGSSYVKPLPPLPGIGRSKRWRRSRWTWRTGDRTCVNMRVDKRCEALQTMWTVAVLKRLITRDRRGHRRSAHAMRDAKRTMRAGIRNPRNRARHAANRRMRIVGALATRRALAEMPQRVIRMIHESGMSELVVATFADRAALRQRGIRTARTSAFRVSAITCLVSVGVAGAAATLRPAHGPAVDGIGLTPAAEFHTVPGGVSGLRPTSGQQQLKDAAPRSDVHSANPENPGPHRPLGSDVAADDPRTGRPLDSQVATDDPELEQALTDLDKQADLDQLMPQQLGLDQPPPLPAAGPPANPPKPGAPPPSASATAPSPLSGPSTVTPPEQKPAGESVGQ